ncbi:hypothetical protein GCM10010425_65450 [Streptomyces spororaveus]
MLWLDGRALCRGTPGRRYLKSMSERRPYPSDLSDARWALVEPLLTSWRDDQARHGLNIGTPPQHSLRDLLDAVLYVARTGIPWRCLPHDYPHWNTVYHYFGRWEKAGIFEQLNGLLRRRVRADEGALPNRPRALSTRRASRPPPASPPATRAPTSARKSSAASGASSSTPPACY